MALDRKVADLLERREARVRTHVQLMRTVVDPAAGHGEVVSLKLADKAVHVHVVRVDPFLRQRDLDPRRVRTPHLYVSYSVDSLQRSYQLLIHERVQVVYVLVCRQPHPQDRDAVCPSRFADPHTFDFIGHIDHDPIDTVAQLIVGLRHIDILSEAE